MTTSNSLRINAALVICLFTSACAHNPNLTKAQQAQINLYSSLDVITTANKTVAQATVALNTQGLISADATRSVRDWSLKVNEAARGALAVLDSAQTPAQKTQAVLDTLKKLDLPKPVADFVNSNPNAEAALAVIRSIVQIQQIIAQINATPPALLSVAKGAK